MQLSSPAFDNETPIPDTYTCFGKNINPPLQISDIPPGTQSLALIVHDPDAPAGDFTHWTVWNISSTASIIPEGRTPSGATSGLNDFNTTGYGPPCPPNGKHHYVFELYALNKQLGLESGSHPYALTASLADHIIAKTQLVGTVTAPKK